MKSNILFKIKHLEVLHDKINFEYNFEYKLLTTILYSFSMER